MIMSKKIEIMEVCPRDGWQNLPEVIPTDVKSYYIDRMLETGIKRMQICSFVNPKAIPQMIDAKEIATAFVKKYKDVEFDALIPNLRGAQSAEECGIKSVSYVVSVSLSHNLANIGSTHEKSKEGLEAIIREYPDLNITLSLATAFGCPFEGEISLDRVMEFVDYGYGLGIRSFELADTIGSATPMQVKAAFAAVKEKYPDTTLTAHMHDTRNNGIINSWMAAMNGADIIHTSLGGLGGCPFAPGASGNTSTEDLVYLLNRDGFETGIDVYKLIELAKEMKKNINGVYSGHHVAIEFDKYERAVREQKAGLEPAKV